MAPLRHNNQNLNNLIYLFILFIKIGKHFIFILMSKLFR